MTASTESHDYLTRFLLPRAGVRGVHVHLGETWRRIAPSDDYPPVVRGLSAKPPWLRRCSQATSRWTGGCRCSCAARARCAPVRRMHRGRHPARPRADADGAGDIAAPPDLAPTPCSRSPSRIPASAAATRRATGLVPLDAPALAEAFESYFSSQNSCRRGLLRPAATTPRLMLQNCRPTQATRRLERASAIFPPRTGELMATPGSTLLHRLFHEEAPELLGACAVLCLLVPRGRVEAMLVSLGRNEAEAALVGGTATVRCEFCGQGYAFDTGAIHALFTSAQRPMEAPTGLQ